MSLRSLVDFLAKRSHLVLLAALVVVGASWGFIELAKDVERGHTQSFDERVVRALRRADDPSVPVGPAWLHEAGRDMTALGGVLVLTLVTFAVAGALLVRGQVRAAGLLLLATLGGLGLSAGLKNYYDRPRPSVVPHLSMVYTSSFPSGHSMLSAVVYLTLGVMLSRLVKQRRLKLYFLCVAMMLSFLVGVSRVYMGVHFPTDVLAGWTAGLVWALLWWMLTRKLQRGELRAGEALVE